MAVAIPDDVTIENLTGRWAQDMDKTTGLSDTFQVQGLSWLIRKVILSAKVVVTLEHNGLNMKMVSGAPGLPMSTSEERILDWTEREDKIAIFGTIKGASRILTLLAGQRVSPYSINDVPETETDDDLAWLSADWMPEADCTIKLLETQGMNVDSKWVAHQVWGFMVINGKRTHVRKILTMKGKKQARATLYYDWLGAVDA